jgi:hypothetical protein
VPADYKAQLAALLAAGRRGDMVALFLTQAVGLPSEMVAQMRQAPFWPAQEALAHTLVYDADVTGDFSVPTERVASVTVPTLVLDGGETPWLSQAAQALAAAARHGGLRRAQAVAGRARRPVLRARAAARWWTSTSSAHRRAAGTAANSARSEKSS